MHFWDPKVSLKMQTCRLRHQFHLIRAEEMEVKTITWGGPERHPAPAQTSLGSERRQQGLRLPSAARRGASGSTKCHSATQCTHLRFPGQDLKGTVAYVRRQKKQYFFRQLQKSVSPACSGLVPLYFPLALEKSFRSLPSQYLHALTVILGKQLGQHIVVSRKHRIRGMCKVYSLKGRLSKF